MKWYRSKEDDSPVSAPIAPSDRARSIVRAEVETASSFAMGSGGGVPDPLATLAEEIAAAVVEYRTEEPYRAHREYHAAIIATGRPARSGSTRVRGWDEVMGEAWVRRA